MEQGSVLEGTIEHAAGLRGDDVICALHSRPLPVVSAGNGDVMAAAAAKEKEKEKEQEVEVEEEEAAAAVSLDMFTRLNRWARSGR